MIGFTRKLHDQIHALEMIMEQQRQSIDQLQADKRDLHRQLTKAEIHINHLTIKNRQHKQVQPVTAPVGLHTKESQPAEKREPTRYHEKPTTGTDESFTYGLQSAAFVMAMQPSSTEGVRLGESPSVVGSGGTFGGGGASSSWDTPSSRSCVSSVDNSSSLCSEPASSSYSSSSSDSSSSSSFSSSSD